MSKPNPKRKKAPKAKPTAPEVIRTVQACVEIIVHSLRTREARRRCGDAIANVFDYEDRDDWGA